MRKKTSLQTLGQRQRFGDFIPEQWIVAAGMDPFLICKGGDPQPPEATLDYMLRFMNPLAATMAGSYLMNLDPVMPIADCVAIQYTFFIFKSTIVDKITVCFYNTCLFPIIERKIPPHLLSGFG